MCWNREVSWATGLSATGISLYLLASGKGNDIPIALVSLTIALMQFAEALMWEGRVIGGRLGVTALFLQPLALVLGILWLRNASLVWMGAWIAIWAAVGLPTLLPMLRKTWPATPGCKGHLQWSFLDPMLASPFAVLYWAVMLGGWLFLKPVQEGVGYAALAGGTLAITWFFFPGEWGSLWCFLANALPLARLLRRL